MIDLMKFKIIECPVCKTEVTYYTLENRITHTACGSKIEVEPSEPEEPGGEGSSE